MYFDVFSFGVFGEFDEAREVVEGVVVEEMNFAVEEFPEVVDVALGLSVVFDFGGCGGVFELEEVFAVEEGRVEVLD